MFIDRSIMEDRRVYDEIELIIKKQLQKSINRTNKTIEAINDIDKDAMYAVECIVGNIVFDYKVKHNIAEWLN